MRVIESAAPAASAIFTLNIDLSFAGLPHQSLLRIVEDYEYKIGQVVVASNGARHLVGVLLYELPNIICTGERLIRLSPGDRIIGRAVPLRKY
jgi:hypothetical protein